MPILHKILLTKNQRISLTVVEWFVEDISGVTEKCLVKGCSSFVCYWTDCHWSASDDNRLTSPVQCIYWNWVSEALFIRQCTVCNCAFCAL